MSQFEVFPNPVARARKAYPFVVILQSDVIDTAPDRIVAPIAPQTRLKATAGRLTPRVKVGGVDHIVLMPSLASLAAADLRMACDDLGEYRDELVAALDYLFVGV